MAITATAFAALLAVALLQAPGAGGQQASSTTHRVAAGNLDAGASHTCAILSNGRVRCWGEGSLGRLGYGNEDDIGDDPGETPNTVGPVSLGRKARAISAGDGHTCALLDNGRVRCWGSGGNGRLGYGNPANIGDTETPGSAGSVNLGRRALAISAGAAHTCAILDDGSVRCWGEGSSGRLGYGNEDDIGDDPGETPNTVGPVNIGPGRKARAIAAGATHTCALLDNGKVRCWGNGAAGRLGYGNEDDIGDDPGETPNTAGFVNLGANRRARAISSGDLGSCAILDNGKVRCWGDGDSGRLGYGNETDIGDTETPAAAGPVNLGPGRTAKALVAGDYHTCVVMDNGKVRCWGYGEDGELGYGQAETFGDEPGETPNTKAPVRLGAGRTGKAIAAGYVHTCALLDNGRVRCWGDNSSGELGYGNTDEIGNDETPDTAGPVRLGGRVRDRAKGRLTMKVRPRRDGSSPFKFRVTGKLLGFVADDATCRGRVTIKSRGPGGTARKRARLRAGRTACTYRARLALGQPGDATVSARFPGSSNVARDRARAKRVRAG